ncbi:MAG: hypothetical protein ACI3VR_13470, partial [Intestinibacter sp.]|uniref:hypothetical protein n=1 Tax=Intestinibacter sp. TaxID=1965304 RepID=UPI003F179215
MIELKLKNRKGSFHVNSKEVKDILAERQDIGYLQDISNSINQENIMVFDCELSEKVFSTAEILEAIEELGESVDESFFEIMFDDVRRFLKDTTDEIEAELQDVYSMDNIKCYFEVYNINQEFTDFKFVFLVSFEDIKIAS